MTSCILLAAGLSERFGSPKALALINNMRAIEQLQGRILDSSCDELIIVLGAFSDQISPHVLNHKRIRVVYNNQYKFGQTSSFQAGLLALKTNTHQALLLPVDCPFIKNSTLDTISQHPSTLNNDILIPTFQGKKGHPPLFNQKSIKIILRLPLDQGINALFTNKSIIINTIEINDPGITQSFNTPQELIQIKKDAS